MKKNIIFWFFVIITMLALKCQAQDLNLQLDFKPELRGNIFLQWLQSIFQWPPFTFVPPLTPVVPTTTSATSLLKECVPCTCGTPNSMNRIVGGKETQAFQYPWMTLLASDGDFYCGGALISDSYVVTAAHCLRDIAASSISISLLVHDRRGNTTQRIDRRASMVIEHENYNALTLYNDIGLIKLSEPVEISDILRPVCMPSDDKTYTAEIGVVTGLGVTSEDGPLAEKLLQVSLPIITNEECIEKYSSEEITDSMLCAGYDEGGKDACQGDSGGPLHVYAENLNIYNLVGVVSWGNGCAEPNNPGVYARVSKFLEWLQTRSNDSCKCEVPTKKIGY